MEAKLKIWKLEIVDLLQIGWSFFALLLIISSSSSFIASAFDNSVLASVISSFVAQTGFLLYAVWANIYFKLGLFEFNLPVFSLLKKVLKYFVLGLFVVYGINIVVNIVANILEYSLQVQAAVDLWLNLDGFLEISLAFFATVILAPIAEELIFRGLLYRLFRTKMSIVLAMILSSFVFAFIHFSLFAFFALFALSLLLCYIYEKFADLRLCILVHSLFNLVNTLFLIFLSQLEQV